MGSRAAGGRTCPTGVGQWPSQLCQPQPCVVIVPPPPNKPCAPPVSPSLPRDPPPPHLQGAALGRVQHQEPAQDVLAVGRHVKGHPVFAPQHPLPQLLGKGGGDKHRSPRGGDTTTPTSRNGHRPHCRCGGTRTGTGAVVWGGHCPPAAHRTGQRRGDPHPGRGQVTGGDTLPAAHLEVVAVEGQGAADQRVEDDAQAPDVHLGAVVLLALEELGGGVGGGPAEGVQFGAQRELVAEPKIGDFDVGVGVQQQVLCLRAAWTGDGEAGTVSSTRCHWGGHCIRHGDTGTGAWGHQDGDHIWHGDTRTGTASGMGTPGRGPYQMPHMAQGHQE